jgi:APA family basic amino acid/polyamine antiporter
MLIMRVRETNMPRRFKTPFACPVGVIAIAGCAYHLFNLPQTTQIYIACAHVVGLVIYFLYGARMSVAGGG